MAVRLILILAGRTIERFENEFEILTVGRNPDCDLMIENVGVSRFHCEIKREGDLCQLRDLGSDNGTSVNGIQITQPYNLNNGDSIGVGKYMIRFEQDPPEDLRPMPEKPKGGRMTSKHSIQSVEKARLKVTAYLELSGGGVASIEKPIFLWGKRHDCDLKMSGWSCPGVVAVLLASEKGFQLLDVTGGGDSITVNGHRKLKAWLSEDDKIVVRDVEAVFHRGRPVSSD